MNDPDLAKLIDGLRNADLWLTIGVAAVAGALGAVVRHATSPPGEEAAKDESKKAWVRWLGRAAVGAVAAVLVLYLQGPTDTLAFIAGSLVAGYAGSSVLASAQNRLLASLAQGEAKEAKAKLTTLRADTVTLLDHVQTAMSARGNDAPPATAQANESIASFRLRHLV